MAKVLKHILVVIISTALLQYLMVIAEVSPAAFALPTEILLEIPKFFLIDHLLPDVLNTLWRTLLSFILALPIGIISGFTVIKVKWIKSEAIFILDFLRSIPATALIPLFLVIFGTGDSSKIAVSIFSGSLVVAISVLVGYEALNADRKRVSDLLGLKGAYRIIFYELPEMSPTIFVGARTAVSLCLILIVVSEMFIGSNDGLGKVIMDERYSDGVPKLYAAIVITGFIGFTINRGFVLIEGRIRRVFAA